MKSILFVTVNNLPTNPRLLKEIVLAKECGYEVSCCLFNLGSHWSSSLNNQIMKELSGVHFFQISASKKPFVPWLISSFVNKVSNILSIKNIAFVAYASNKRTWLLKRNMPREHYDMVIAHNLGALYAAYFFSKKYKTRFSFDIEDYHPGEVLIKGKDDKEIERREFLMKRILPDAAYVSYASPLIGQRSLTLCDIQAKPPHLLINNTFNKSEFTFCECIGEKVELVWFSQTVSYGRGLELLLPVLAKWKHQIHLTIIGNLNQSFYENILSSYDDFITIKAPLPQALLHKEIGKYDVGVAFEIPVDLNRNLCLTNKIFAYALAGLFVLSTDLAGQKQFLDTNPGFGVHSALQADEISKSVEYLIENLVLIRAGKKDRFERSFMLSWEKEAEQIKEFWKTI